MTKFVIEGGTRLKGSLSIKGAKNSMLPIMAAVVLSGSSEDIELQNIPAILDMHVMTKILRSLGATVKFADNTLRINVKDLHRYTIRELTEMRLYFLMGSLLACFGASGNHPGGCSSAP